MSCALFETAIELDSGDRAAFVESGSNGDPAVIRLVMRMLSADSAHANPIDRLAEALAAGSRTALDEMSEAGISTTDARGADHA